MRTLIIGDIHGCYFELLALLDAAAVTTTDIVVSVGDLVDRGPAPTEVVRFFRDRPNSVVVMGNHERKHVRDVLSYSQEVTRCQMADTYADGVAWMRGLPYFYETPDIRVVHAAVIPGGGPLAQQPEAILSGTTSGEAQLKKLLPDGRPWHAHYAESVPVAFGHHIVGPEPLVREGFVYGLDTGACHGQRLTALSVPDFTLYSVPARTNYWREVGAAYQVPVLRTKPWTTMAWRKLDDTVAELEHRPAPATTAFLAAIVTWANDLRALTQTFPARIEAIADELRTQHGAAGFDAALRDHPAKPLLFKLGRGRLTAADIAERCPSAQTTLALAAKLGVDTTHIVSPV